MPELPLFVWARNVGAVLGLLTFAGTAVGWIAKSSFQRGFIVVLPWAGLACLVAVLAFSAYVAQVWFRIGLFFHGDLTGRRRRRVFSATRFLLAVTFRTETGRVMAGLVVVGTAGLLVELWALETNRKLPPMLIAAVGVSLAVLALIGSIEIGYEKLKASRKPCPDCGESVKQIANVCRYCGYRFAPPPPPHEDVELPT